MAEKKKREVQPIFLNQAGIRLWSYEGLMDLPGRWGVPTTKLIQDLGMEVIDEHAKNWRITGSVTKYLADVMRYDPKKDYKNLMAYGGDGKFEPTREILFTGGIEVYKNGVVPGSEIQGYHLVAHGEVFLAKPPATGHIESENFYDYLFKDRDTPQELANTIELIAQGYLTQEKAERERQWEAKHRSWKSGRDGALEQIYGTFGRHF